MLKIFPVLMLILPIIGMFSPSIVKAETVNGCQGSNYVISSEYPFKVPEGEDFDITVTFNGKAAEPSYNYFVLLTNEGFAGGIQRRSNTFTNVGLNNNSAVFTIHSKTDHTGVVLSSTPKPYDLLLMHTGWGGAVGEQSICRLGTVSVINTQFSDFQCKIQMPDLVNRQEDSIQPIITTNPIDGVAYNFYIYSKNDAAGLPREVYVTSRSNQYNKKAKVTKSEINSGLTRIRIENQLVNGDYVAAIEAWKKGSSSASTKHYYCVKFPFTISNEKTSEEKEVAGEKPAEVSGGGSSSAGGEPCEDKNSTNPGLSTAIGCIHTNPAEFTKDLMTFAIGIGGGLSFLMMLLGAFQMLTSAGNPDSLKAGQDRFTSAIIGLLFIIFAVLLMQIIGVGILAIPDFK